MHISMIHTCTNDRYIYDAFIYYARIYDECIYHAFMLMHLSVMRASMHLWCMFDLATAAFGCLPYELRDSKFCITVNRVCIAQWLGCLSTMRH